MMRARRSASLLRCSIALALAGCGSAGTTFFPAGDGGFAGFDFAAIGPGPDGGGGGVDLAAGGGSDGGGEPPLFESGSRLRVVWGDLGGGARAFRGWHDRKLGVRCWFRVADDGRVRCLPQEFVSDSVFADARCSQPLLYADCNASGYGTSSMLNGDHCSPNAYTYRAWRVTGRHNGAAYVESQGSCSAAPAAYANRLFLGQLVAPSEFVAATPRTVMAGARLRVELLDGEDGSHQRLWQYHGTMEDTQRGAPCTVMDAWIWHIDETVCAPTGVFGSSVVYGDAACTQPLSQLLNVCPGVTMALHDEDRGGCRRTLRALQMAQNPARIYSLYNGQCSGTSPQANARYSPLGPPIPAGAVPVLRSVALDNSRLTQMELQTETGEPLAREWALLDRGANARCQPASIGSPDNLRCLPPAVANLAALDGYRYWADARCTRELAFAGGCQQATLAVRPSSVCGVSYAEVYTVAAPTVPATYYYTDPAKPGTCTAANSNTLTFQELIAPVDPATLPAIVESVE